MNKLEIKNALELINKGINNLISAIDTEEDSSSTEIKATRGNAVAPKMSRVEPEVSECKEEEVVSVPTDNLEECSYNELKKLAKELNLSAKGTKSELIEKIKKTQSTAVEVEPDDSVSPAEEEVIDNNNGSDLVAKVNEAVKEMSDEEIADILVSCGISASGKRKALIDKVVNGVREGVIDFDEEEEEEDLPEPSDVKEVPAPTENVEEVEGEQEFEFDSPSGINNIKDKSLMTPERASAISNLVTSIVGGINSEKIAYEDMSNLLVSYGYDEKDIEQLSFEELVNYYIDTKAMFIDDEGTEQGMEEPYMVNEVPYCCGYELNKVDDTYVCESCGAEYEAE